MWKSALHVVNKTLPNVETPAVLGFCFSEFYSKERTKINALIKVKLHLCLNLTPQRNYKIYNSGITHSFTLELGAK